MPYVVEDRETGQELGFLVPLIAAVLTVAAPAISKAADRLRKKKKKPAAPVIPVAPIPMAPPLPPPGVFMVGRTPVRSSTLAIGAALVGVVLLTGKKR